MPSAEETSEEQRKREGEEAKNKNDVVFRPNNNF